ncbi:glycosyltransferase family 4 protein [Vibrio parahaemolyticus]|nr:glycosyltransferase family 4 protein [Vibrio parahaemolyticus]
MKKISIAFYSTFKRPGWKSEQLESLVPKLRQQNMFHKGYGLRFLRNEEEKDLFLSPLPLIVAKIIRTLSFLPFIKDYYHYLSGEHVFGLLFNKKLKNDDSNIVFLKPRPFNLVKSCKEHNKYVVLEFGELHPLDTYKRMKREYEKYPTESEYIYTSKYAIDEAIKSIELADKIIVLSEESKQSFIRNGVPQEKIKKINLGLNEAYNKSFDDRKPIAFVSTAKHSYVKGTHKLLLAWRKAEIKDTKLFIVGEVSKDIELFVEQFGPFENVIFTGKKNIHEFYQDYNFVGILNSLSEGYGRVVVEYMGYGFPVITTPVATCDIVVEGVNGFIVENEDMLINALHKTKRDKELYRSMGQSAKDCAEKTLEYNYTSEIIKLFKGL